MGTAEYRPEVIFFSNGPGEVMGWLAPTLHHVRLRIGNRVRVTVVIPPCDFSSGEEDKLVKSLNGVEQLISPRRYLKFLVFGSKASGVSFPSSRGVVVHLGGDHFQSGIMARRLGYRAIAYTEGRIHHERFFNVIAADYHESRERLISAGVDPGKVVTVGNLMVDGVCVHIDRVAHARAIGVSPDRPVVGVLPGSRARWLGLTMKLLADAVDSVAAQVPSAQFVLLLAPTVSWSDLCSVVAGLGMQAEVLGSGVTGNGSSRDHAGRVVTISGTNIVVVASNRYDTMNCMDVAVTVPGTNTMELASLGIPMVVFVPLNEPERIPLEGLPGLIGSVPIIGPWIKGKAVLKQASKTMFVALPNRRAGTYVVPEVKGRLTGSDIAAPVHELLVSAEKRHRVSSSLKSIAGEAGAGMRLAAIIADQLQISEND